MGKCADIVLTSEGGVLADAPEVPVTLPMRIVSCEYSLLMNDFVLTTLKNCRQLRVKGSVTNGKLIISIQTGTDTPRIFEFENVPEFSLTEDLLKNDKVSFSYIGTDTVIDIKAKISQK